MNAGDHFGRMSPDAEAEIKVFRQAKSNPSFNTLSKISIADEKARHSPKILTAGAD